MYTQFCEKMSATGVIRPGEKVVLGVSGGMDSQALLYLLAKLKETISFELHIAHVNHGIRGEEADGDQRLVEACAKVLRVPFHVYSGDMNGFAKEHNLSKEEAGRVMRYAFFEQVLHEINGDFIVTAHNKDDQGETVLLNLLRGSGLEGLVGMSQRSGNRLKPLLGVTRQEIESFVITEAIPYRDDATNFEPIYKRNRLRLELLPLLKEAYNPSVIDHLSDMADLLRDDLALLKDVVTEAFYRLNVFTGKSRVVLDRVAFRREKPGLKRRLIRYCIEKVKGDLTGFSREHTEQFMAIAHGETGKRQLINGVQVEASYDDLIFSSEEDDVEEGIVTAALDLNSQIVNVSPKFTLEATEISREGYNESEKDKLTAFFDLDAIDFPLTLRKREDGDRIQLVGMEGSKKIKDLFIDEKIPVHLRDGMPLLFSGAVCLWAIPLRQSRVGQITDETTRILKLIYTPGGMK